MDIYGTGSSDVRHPTQDILLPSTKGFYTKMIVGIPCQCAFACARFQDSLRQSYGCRYAVLFLLFQGYLFVLGDISEYV